MKLRFDYAQPEQAIGRALEARAITETEAELLRTAARAMRRAIDVDAFAPDPAAQAAEPSRARDAVDV